MPDGTITVPQPATCPELADLYNAPACAYPHDLIYIPMDITFIPNTGGEVFWWLIIPAIVLISVGAALFAGAFIRAGHRRGES